MPEPILRSAAPPVIPVESTTPANGNGEKPFNQQFEEMLTAAYAEKENTEKAKANEKQSAPVREVSPATQEEETKTAQPTEKVQEAKPTGADIRQPAKAAQWKEVNEERAKLKAENEAFKAEQEKWKQWETERKEYDTVKRHNAELLDRIQTIAVEKDPRFENYFKTKTDTAIALAKQAVGDGHAERVSKLLQLPDSDWRTEQLETVMSELGPTRQSRLGAAIVEMDRINLERSTAISRSKENWEAMQRSDHEKNQHQKQELERTFQDTLSKWRHPETGLSLFRDKENDQAHNAEVKQRIDTARNILNVNLSADQLSKAALWSAAAPGLLKDLLASRERETKLMSELESIKSGGPELKGETSEEKEIDEEKMYPGMTPNEIMIEKIKKAGGWSR